MSLTWPSQQHTVIADNPPVVTAALLHTDREQPGVSQFFKNSARNAPANRRILHAER